MPPMTIFEFSDVCSACCVVGVLEQVVGVLEQVVGVLEHVAINSVFCVLL